MTKLLLLFLLPLCLLANDKNTNSTINPIFTPEESAWLAKKQTVTYVYDPDWAPFEWKNDMNQHDGIIANIMTIVGHKTGIEFIAQNTETWGESVELVKSKKINMFSAITQNSKREKYLNFISSDIISYPAVLVTQFHDRRVYLDMAKDFQDKKIGIVEESGLGNYIKEKYPELNFIMLSSTQEGFESLKNSEIDIFAINAITAKYLIENKYINTIKIAMKLDYIYHLKMAVHKDFPKEIISILDKALNCISQRELNDIFNKWTHAPIEEETDWKLILQIVSAFLFIVLLFILHNRKLQRMIDDRTKKLSILNQKLHDLAQTDMLTGISNRLNLQHDFDLASKKAQRLKHNMALYFIDLDDFKDVNDHLGHDVGDRVLKEIAQKINTLLSKNEKVYRVGGDEFCVLVTEFSSEEQLEELAQKIINEISDIGRSDQDIFKLGCSIGISVFPENGETLRELMASADGAMYSIKALNKNHFYFAK